MQDQLEQTLYDHPDDLGAFSVYADWLTERGDPRGAFVRLQLQLEDPSLSAEVRRSLQDRERALLRKHRRDWLGPLAGPLIEPDEEASVSWTFERGFLGSLELRRLTTPLATALAGAPQPLRLLRALSLEHCYDDDAVPALWEIPLPNVRRFHYGDGTGSLPEEGQAATIASGMPRLEELSVSGRRVQTDSLVGLCLRHLRSLTVSCAHRFHVPGLAANASLGQLQSLALFPHALEPGDRQAYLQLADIEALAASPHLGSLCRLTLWQCTAGDPGCQVLSESGLLSRLQELDLSYGEITDEGAAILASATHLRSLSVEGNSLTEKGKDLLRAAGIPSLKMARQQQWGSDREYLQYGDCE